MLEQIVESIIHYLGLKYVPKKKLPSALYISNIPIRIMFTLVFLFKKYYLCVIIILLYPSTHSNKIKLCNSVSKIIV